MSYSQGTKLQDKISQEIIACVGKMVYKEGANGISVRAVLKELNITNRVFYNRFRNIDEVLLIISQKIVKEMRQEDIRRIIILYNPKGKITKIIIDDGSYQQEKSFYHQSGEEKSKFTFCFFDYTKAREKYIEKCWPDMPIEKVASYGDVT